MAREIFDFVLTFAEYKYILISEVKKTQIKQSEVIIMKYTKIYAVSGTSKKADATDYVDKYIAENGEVIEIMSLINTSYKWYKVGNKEYDTLKEAKTAIEKQ